MQLKTGFRIVRHRGCAEWSMGDAFPELTK